MKSHFREKHRHQKPFVLAIAGTSGAGKTTVVQLLAEKLERSSVLMFDDYADEDTYPQDFEAFAARGFDLNELKSVKFAADIASICEGNSVIDPQGKTLGETPKILILEEPTGRNRDVMKKLIDYVVFLDLPYAISLARRISRTIENNTDKESCLQEINGFTKWYMEIGYELYQTVGDKVLAESNISVNALQNPDTIVQEIIETLNAALVLP